MTAVLLRFLRQPRTKNLIRLLTVLLAVCAPRLDPAWADNPPARTTFKLVKVRTPRDNADDSVSVTVEADGTQTVVGKSTPTCKWHVDVKNARATATSPNASPPATLDVTWTTPPDYWSSDQDFTISATANDVGNDLGGVRYFQEPAETWQQSPGTQIQGHNPFDHVQAGQGSGGFTPSDSGSITLRPKSRIGKDIVTLTVRLASFDGCACYIHYDYQPFDGPVPPTPPPHTCTKGFAKDWSTTWGDFNIHLDGNKATGTYANRTIDNGPGTFTGTISGNTLNANWTDAKGTGTLTLTLSDDGCSFNGTNTVNGSTGQGQINGKHNPGGTDGGGTGGTVTTGTGTGGTGTGGTGTGGTGTGTTSTGGGSGGLPPDPGSDPVSQNCIQKWLDKAMSILNRRDKSNPAPGGPWHVGKYGTLQGHQVVGELPPEGWESTYHSNVYAYVWANWQKANQDPAYGGELESLADFVKKCDAANNPNGGTTGGTTGTGGGPVTDPNNPPTVSRMTLWAQKRTAQSGQLVSLPIWLLKGADVANMNFNVTFNASIAKPEGDSTKGYVINDALFTSNAGESGLVRVGFAIASGVGGDGPVCYIPFRVTGKPGDSTPITLAVTTINNTGGATPSIDVINGQIHIVGADGMLPGDCDGDGALTAADAWCALRMSVKLMPDKSNMDMDHDGQVTSRDAAIILQKVVGK